MWSNLEKRQFFQADMAGLGKYRMGGGRIGVLRVKMIADILVYTISKSGTLFNFGNIFFLMN